jgi:hypothetical protein
MVMDKGLPLIPYIPLLYFELGMEIRDLTND